MRSTAPAAYGTEAYLVPLKFRLTSLVVACIYADFSSCSFELTKEVFPRNEISLTEEGSPRLCSSSVYQFLVPRYSFSCTAWAMTTYRVTRRPFRSQPLKAIGLLDVEGSQTCFSAMDVRKISLHLFARPPYPEIIIEVHFYQDSNQRNHDGAPDYVNENGTKFWIFPFSD